MRQPKRALRAWALRCGLGRVDVLSRPWMGRGEDAMRFVRRLTSKMGMRGRRPTNEGAQRAAVEKPPDTQQDSDTKRERWRRRAAEQMGTYVGAVQPASQLARKHAAQQLRKGIHAARSINVSIL